MPKVSVRTRDQAPPAPLPAAFAGEAKASAYFEGERYPLHLHCIEIAKGETLRIAQSNIDKLAYVWRGGVIAGGRTLAEKSSLIVEHGAELEIIGVAEHSVLLAFSAAEAATQSKSGGHVHLLPAERTPRSENLGGREGLGGAMHADSDCPTCALWLHENRFPGAEASAANDEAGVHSHSEDEIIFVLDGEMRLGKRLCGPGSALFVARDTLYSFTAGPNGLHFVNFRAGKPGDIQFLKAPPMNETAYWRERLPRPDYLSPAS